MDSMFDKLLQLPLFQGLTHEEFQRLIESFPFHFLKAADGERIATVGEPCSHLRFIVAGAVRFSTSSRVLRVAVEHTLDSPDVIAPDHLFGLDTRYPFDAWASGETALLQIKKLDFLDMLSHSHVLAINILNYLSRNAQSVKYQLMGMQNVRVAERLALIATLFTAQRSRDIKIVYRQRDLNHVLGLQSSRIALADTCAQFQKMGLVRETAPGEISFGNRQDLIDFLNDNFQPAD